MFTKTALIYDWMDTEMGGVERILETFASLFPQAHWYCAHADAHHSPMARSLHPKTSFMQKLPSAFKSSRAACLPLYPYAFERINLSSYDLVISITSAFAKSVITHPRTHHISYLLTPTRYLWGQTEQYLTPRTTIALSPFLSRLRAFDYISAARPDKIVSISRHVARRVDTYYNRASDVIYPPFDNQYWDHVTKTTSSKSLPSHLFTTPFYLVVNRLEPYKKTEIAIRACASLGHHLVIVGRGSHKPHLLREPNSYVTWLENVDDSTLAALYAHAQALLMPQEEDFGMVALEAQYGGCPVITYGNSGAAETILVGKTGISFPTQTTAALCEAIASYHKVAYNMRQKAQKYGPGHIKQLFGKQRFMNEFSDIIPK